MDSSSNSARDVAGLPVSNTGVAFGCSVVEGLILARLGRGARGPSGVGMMLAVTGATALLGVAFCGSYSQSAKKSRPWRRTPAIDLSCSRVSCCLSLVRGGYAV